MSKNRALGLLVALLAGPLAVVQAAERYGVVIGINDYADPEVPDLRYAESDAQALYDTLIDPAVGRFSRENVKLLLGAQATPSAIKSAMYALRGVDHDDLVVLFYSGHGAKHGDEAYWVTQNAEARALPATALSNTELRAFLEKIPSERLVVLLDCCYAASTVKKDLGDPAELLAKFAGKGRVTIAGAAENQEALEDPDAKAGIFTHFLVAGLRGAADVNADGVVTFEEIWTYLGENVRKASVKQGGLHEPKIITEDGVTPQFLLTFNPTAQNANDSAVAKLRDLFDANQISGAQYDQGRTALTSPALTTDQAVRREVYGDLAAGKLAPKYLADVLKRRLRESQPAPTAASSAEGKPSVAVVPFDVLGRVKVDDAGKILAERLLPNFAGRYSLIDQMQLRHFLEQDDLGAAGLSEIATLGRTKSLSKAVKLRAVRFLVVGTVSGMPDGSFSVTARLCDWQTGDVEAGRIAQVGAKNWEELLRRLPILAARLGGALSDLMPATAPLDAGPAGGADALLARAHEVQAVAAELEDALATLTAKHPRIVELRKRHEALSAPLKQDVEEKIAELRATDAKLAEWYQAGHPQRLALADQLASLTGVLNGRFWSVESARPGDTLTLDLGGGVTMDLVLIPSGEFMMGSPETEQERGSDERRHRVQITKPFYMGKYEVTQAQWQAVMGSNPSNFKGNGNLPVEQVSWDDCQGFCQKLSQRCGRQIRLPTEAEWEYACRAGTTTPFHFGATLSTDQANYDGNYTYGNGGKGEYREKTTPSGSFPANAWGIYDMHGNVWEWCSDWYGSDYYASSPQDDPQGPASGALRVLRGGSWDDVPWYLRSALRVRYRPGNRGLNNGFRVASGT